MACRIERIGGRDWAWMVFRQLEPRPVKVHIVGISLGDRVFSATAFVPEGRGERSGLAAVERIYHSLRVS